MKTELSNMTIDSDQGRKLLRMARTSIENPSAADWGPERWEALGLPITPEMLLHPRGVFVTLHAGADLRGCIGTLSGRRPLYSLISRFAVAAAYEDPRFPPVGPAEIGLLRIHISILSPDRALSSIDEIRLGIDGVVLNHPDGQAVFLPEVATETGWSRTEMLSHLSRKAGLSAESWEDPGARVFAFETLAFGEEKN